MTIKEYISRDINEIEVKTGPSFTEILTNLSDINNPVPLNSKQINIPEIREFLLNAGIEINLIENDTRLERSIRSSKFRHADQGKGPAVVKVLGGLENYNKFLDWAKTESKSVRYPYPYVIDGSDIKDEPIECRGLMQFIGDTIALASRQLSPEKYCEKTNLRVIKEYSDKKIEDMPSFFSNTFSICYEFDIARISSIPKGSASKAFNFILSLKK